jgi:hypothetical protein
MEARTVVEGAMAEEQARLQAEATQAAAAQEQASRQLLEASQAPLNVDPLSQSLPLLLGHIASVIGQDKSFVEHGRQQARDERAQMIQARKENLLALQQNFKEQADSARQAGDLLAEAAMRTKLESASKQMDVLLQNQRQTFEAQFNETPEQRLKRELAVARARDEGEQKSPADLAALSESVAAGQSKLRDYGKATAEQIVPYMKANGLMITPDPARKAMDELGSAEAAIAEIATLSEQVNTAGPGPGRFATGAINRVKGWLQSDSAAAQFETVRGGLAGNLSRAIQAERGVLTNQDRAFAMRLLPTRDDTQQVAREKIDRLQRFIAYKKASAMKAYTTAFGADPETGKAKPKPAPRYAKVLPSIRDEAMKLALSDDPDKLNKIEAMIKQNPALDLDDDLKGILEAETEANIEAVQGSQPR